jgi:hypothetical protein
VRVQCRLEAFDRRGQSIELAVEPLVYRQGRSSHAG